MPRADQKPSPSGEGGAKRRKRSFSLLNSDVEIYLLHRTTGLLDVFGFETAPLQHRDPANVILRYPFVATTRETGSPRHPRPGRGVLAMTTDESTSRPVIVRYPFAGKEDVAIRSLGRAPKRRPYTGNRSGDLLIARETWRAMLAATVWRRRGDLLIGRDTWRAMLAATVWRRRGDLLIGRDTWRAMLAATVYWRRGDLLIARDMWRAMLAATVYWRRGDLLIVRDVWRAMLAATAYWRRGDLLIARDVWRAMLAATVWRRRGDLLIARDVWRAMLAATVWRCSHNSQLYTLISTLCSLNSHLPPRLTPPTARTVHPAAPAPHGARGRRGRIRRDWNRPRAGSSGPPIRRSAARRRRCRPQPS